MRTWFDFYTQKWVSEKPQRYWTGLTCIETKEKIFVGDTISINTYTLNNDKIEKVRRRVRVPDIYTDSFVYFDLDQRNNPILISHY
jgi:hypothetical protein